MVKHVMKNLKKILKIKKKKGKLIKSKLGDKYSIAKRLKGKLDALRAEMEAAVAEHARQARRRRGA